MSSLSPLRADATRNRQRLLRVAREQFSAFDGSATLEEIAKLAGVGIGTLYRHFPSREALAEAVYCSELDFLMADSEALLKQHSAFQALRIWMDHYSRFAATKHAMYETLRSAFTSRSGPPLETRAKIRTSIGRFLSASVRDGTIRGDVGEDDLTVSLAATVLATRLATDEAQLGRVLDLLVEGLRSRS